MAAQKEKEEWEVKSGGEYMGEISALCFLKSFPNHLPFLLAGCGSQVLVYDLESSKLIRSFFVFHGIRVHGITTLPSTTSNSSPPPSFVIAIYGERKVKLFNLSFFKDHEQSHGEERCSFSVELKLLQSLPRFTHWVLDVSFFKDCRSVIVGCSNNSISVWDISTSTLSLQLHSPDKCLLYSMRLWGNNLESLLIASGTIFNQIIVWKVVVSSTSAQHSSTLQTNDADMRISSSNCTDLQSNQLQAVNICRLVGHEGSIFRIAWSSSGSKLVSVSDDRSARIWELPVERPNSGYLEENFSPSHAALVLFGHTARIWDCFLSDSLIVTAGEDCTCRVWGHDGRELKKIKEHVGRGIWRCLYDPESSLLITAGFDCAVKAHQLHVSMQGGLEGHAEVKEFIDRTEIFTIHIPNSAEYIGHMNSKSEYVRCLRFICEDNLYVATNRGYLYHAKLSAKCCVNWTELVRVSCEVPVICMDLFPRDQSELQYAADDWIAIGDGKGNMTVVTVTHGPCTPKVTLSFAWPAELDRQLLGTYWCKSLGFRYVFTADPKGKLKLWSLSNPVDFVSSSLPISQHVSLVAEFISSYGTRIMCLDASIEGEVLVCGDLRGNLILFPLSKDLLLSRSNTTMKTVPQNCFRGAHGISSVSSISLVMLGSHQFEIHSTGADGCICYFKYIRDLKNLEFTGMKQVKELRMVQSLFADRNSLNGFASARYAAGFASADFIIWNILDEAKVVQISCGGWRRPYSYYLGAIPEAMHCFAYVKDDNIYIHRNWVTDSERKIFPQSLHMQFHGREIHSLCFVSEDLQVEKGKDCLSSKSSWIATGCEDGTVRLTRYTPNDENWSVSNLLGEHVGGSAVRSICSVSKLQIMTSDLDEHSMRNRSSIDDEKPWLLISVGAKRVVTSWLLRNRKVNKEDSLAQELHTENGDVSKSKSKNQSSMSFQWLSTDMPIKHSIPRDILMINQTCSDVKCSSPYPENESKYFIGNNDDDDDWRYLAVTAFLVKSLGSRMTVCFVVVACSDASVMLRALVLPYRLWFDVALLVPRSSPVLALQHVTVPLCRPSEGKAQIKYIYILMSGSTDGSIAFWDMTGSVETFMQRVSTLQIDKFIDCQRRPRTGRGSQGGRKWRSLTSSVYKKRLGSTAITMEGKENNPHKVDISHETITNLSEKDGSLTTITNGEEDSPDVLDRTSHGTLPIDGDPEVNTALWSQAMNTISNGLGANEHESLIDICELQPLHILNNLHQSGVNCLHVSDTRDCQRSHSGFVYNLISGGDDQALLSLRFEVLLQPLIQDSEIIQPNMGNSITETECRNSSAPCNETQKDYAIRFLNHAKFASAHSSAIKGVWTNGVWAFSTGLDQRVRCWRLGKHGELAEHSHVVVSVPEPEALDARACSRNHFQIAVAGRGMQMVEFSTSGDTDGRE